MTTIQGQITSCASSISQAAGLAALGVSDEDMQVSFDVMRKKVRRKERTEIFVGSKLCVCCSFMARSLSHRYSTRRIILHRGVMRSEKSELAVDAELNMVSVS